MVKPLDTASIEKATDTPWSEWTDWLDTQQANEMTHAQIAELAYGKLEGTHSSPGWWAQTIAVAYEQHIGRRLPGQKADDTFEVSVSKTREGSRDEIYAACLDLLKDTESFNGHAIENVRTSTTEVRSYWRCDLTDSGKLTVAVEEKAPGKVLITITHAHLNSPEEVESWRQYWKAFLAQTD